MSQVMKLTIGVLLLAAVSVACSSESRGKSEANPQTAELETAVIIARVKADLNGDGLPDLATLIPFEFMEEGGAINYEKIAAWPYYSEGRAPDGPAGGGPVVLVIDHGVDTDGKVSEGFVLYDPNSVSVLATSAAEHLTSTRPEKILEKAAGLKDLPQSFSGEVLVLPTEAGIDTFIYWTGSTYKVFEPLELP